MTSIALFASLFATPAIAEDLDAPEVLEANMAFTRLGLGAGAGVGGGGSGTALGGGWRMHSDRYALEVGGGWVLPGSLEDANTFSLGVHVAGLYYVAPDARASAYAGAGLGVGYTGGFGLQADLMGGYELMRDKPFRLFVEGDLTLPLHGTTAYDFEDGSVDDGYRVGFTATVGIAYRFGGS